MQRVFLVLLVMCSEVLNVFGMKNLLKVLMVVEKLIIVVDFMFVLCVVLVLLVWLLCICWVYLLWKIIGIMWKVELLLMLVKKNSRMKVLRKLKKLFWLLLFGRKVIIVNILLIISVQFYRVICVLLNLFVSQLFRGWLRVFISGLRKVYCSGLMLGNWVLLSIVKLVEKLMNELKVVMYSQYISQLCLCLKIIVWLWNEVLVLVMLFILNQVVIDIMVMNGIQIQLVFCSYR